MRIKPFQAVYPNFDFITSADGFFNTIKYEYPEYRKSGFFKKTAQDALYLYRIQKGKGSYTGIVACADIQDYLEGKSKKHENTLAAKEQQQMHLMISRNAVVKPVLLTYPEVPEITSLIVTFIEEHEAFYSVRFEKSGELHTFWEIRDGALIQRLEDLFRERVSATYIADGHHRCSTTGLMYQRLSPKSQEGNCGLLLAAFFAGTELRIHDYNRVVEGLSDTSLTHFMARLSQLFEIEVLEKAEKPRAKHEIVMMINREWYRLRWKAEVLKTYEHQEVLLDVSLLDELVISGIMGIEDVRTDVRIRYVEGPKGISEVRSRTIKNEQRVGFLLYPATLDDLLRTADAGKTMPPKSTWFAPRIKNGLIVLELALELGLNM